MTDVQARPTVVHGGGADRPGAHHRRAVHLAGVGRTRAGAPVAPAVAVRLSRARRRRARRVRGVRPSATSRSSSAVPTTATLAAFYNVCQHRGARVMVNDRGWIRQFVCPYHGWSYDTRRTTDRRARRRTLQRRRRLRGPIVAARAGRVLRRARVGLHGPRRRRSPQLPRARCGTASSPTGCRTWPSIGDQTVHLDCNWKAVFDNFGELYHVEHIHPQHEKMFDCPTAQIDLFAGGHTGVIIDGHTVNTRLPRPRRTRTPTSGVSSR